MEGSSLAPDHQQNASTQAQTAALATLLDAAGLEPADLLTALKTLADAKQATQRPPEQGKSIYQDKELIYEDEDAFIYRRGDTKNKIYYLRIYDKKSKKPYIKSLGEKDRVKAITKARLIYQELIGKIDRGERLKSITTQELIDTYLSGLEKTITDIPKVGITPETYRVKSYFLSKWNEYINFLGYKNTPIDKIPADKTRDYGIWSLNQPKKDGTPRSREHINKTIAEIKKAYREVAVRNKYIGRDQIPEIDLLKQEIHDGYKKDILTIEQYEKLWKYMLYKWIPEKGISNHEKQKRVIFYNAIGLLYNTGLRPKELLGLKAKEITKNEADTPELQKTHLKIMIRKENSKTGRSRVVVVPIRKRVERIKSAYNELGLDHEPQDFLLFNPSSSDRKSYTRQSLDHRLQQVLEKSGLKAELEAEGRKISLYSSRHAFITWRLRYGNVPIHLLSKAVGTSIKMIEQTYGHIEVEKQTELLTRGQGYAQRAEVDLSVKVDGTEI